MRWRASSSCAEAAAHGGQRRRDAVAEPAPAGGRASSRAAEKLSLVVLSGKVEMEIAELDAGRPPQLPRRTSASTEPARDRFIQAAYALLDLISFLTAGEDEVPRLADPPRHRPRRAPPARSTATSSAASSAPRSSPYEDFVQLGTEAKCREAGKLRLEGKEYVVADGDVINFRFNV